MSIRFYCPSGHQLRAPDRKTGREICCPVCRQRAIVPEADDRVSLGGGNPPAPLPPEVVETAAPAEPLPAGSGPPPLPGTDGVDKKTNSTERKSGADRRWFRRQPQRMPADTYRPDPARTRSLQWLASFLAFVVVFSTFPAWGHLDLQVAPGWARLVLLLAALQGCYILWMLATPDWSSVWVVMLVFAFAAAVYAMLTAIVLATPLDRPVPLDIGELRPWAPRWCGSVLGLMVLATYLSGLTSARWRRAVEREMARTGGMNDRTSEPA
jgi:hypothetical protein